MFNLMCKHAFPSFSKRKIDNRSVKLRASTASEQLVVIVRYYHVIWKMMEGN